MNKTEKTADELMAEAEKRLEEAYYLLNDAAAHTDDKYMRRSIMILRKIVSNARAAVGDFL